MANSEACQVWIDQRVKEEQEQGTPHAEIGRLVGAEIMKYFKTKIEDRSIEQQSRRIATNVATIATTQKHSESTKKPQRNEDGKFQPGTTPGPGRKPKYSPVIFNTTNENIGWAAYSWNPVTGCEHGCPYCYAHDIANRFYPEKFKPTLRENKLSAPKDTKINPKLNNRVFTCSMGELFGPWVPDEWIGKVFENVRQNPQWTFLFLTKSPERLPALDWPSNAWIGASIDTKARIDAVTEAFSLISGPNIKFISCEPLLGEIILPHKLLQNLDWFIVGAKSEGKKKVQPKIEWVEALLNQTREYDIPVWFKDNLIFRPQEIPILED